MASNLYRASPTPKRKVFVSYHHGGDQAYYEAFAQHFSTMMDVISDKSLERARDSDNAEYIIRYIREKHLTGASTIIVLCGTETRWRKYVDWEIFAGLGQKMGVVGVQLPTNRIFPNGSYNIPDRLKDNIDTGYAVWATWAGIIHSLSSSIEDALSRSKILIDNSRPRRVRNG